MGMDEIVEYYKGPERGEKTRIKKIKRHIRKAWKEARPMSELPDGHYMTADGEFEQKKGKQIWRKK